MKLPSKCNWPNYETTKIKFVCRYNDNAGLSSASAGVSESSLALTYSLHRWFLHLPDNPQHQRYRYNQDKNCNYILQPRPQNREVTNQVSRSSQRPI